MPRTCLGTNKQKYQSPPDYFHNFVFVTISPDYFYRFPPSFVTPVKLPDRRDGSEEPTVQWRPNAEEPLKTSSWEKTDQPEPLNISYWRKRPERKETNQRPDGKHRPIILFSPGQKTSATNRTKSLFSTEKSYQQRIYWLLSTIQKYIFIFYIKQTLIGVSNYDALGVPGERKASKMFLGTYSESFNYYVVRWKQLYAVFYKGCKVVSGRVY